MKYRTVLLAGLLACHPLIEAEVITCWNFNSQLPDTDLNTGSLLPAYGSGVAGKVGAVTDSFTAANGSSDLVADNSNWRISNWPAQGAANKENGVRFAVSTVGFRRIRIGFDLRNSNTASKYARLQYSTDGVNFVDHTVIAMTAEAWVNEQVISLADVPTVENNPHFAFRIVTEFEATAIGSGASGYVPSRSGSTYGANGTMRFDLVMAAGDPLTPNPQRTVKLLDYNVWGADSTNWTPTDPQVQAIGRQMACLNPDVITLQEIPNRGLAQMPAIIATYLPGYHLATNRVSDGNQGNLIVSRWPIIQGAAAEDGRAHLQVTGRLLGPFGANGNRLPQQGPWTRPPPRADDAASLPAAQPVHQPRVSGGPIPSPHPLGLPVAQPQYGRRVHQVEFSRLYSRNNDGTTPFFRTHD